MTRPVPTQADLDQLEQLTDRVGFSRVLLALSLVCGEKAAHAMSTWQDVTLARQWNDAGRACERFSTYPSIVELSR